MISFGEILTYGLLLILLIIAGAGLFALFYLPYSKFQNWRLKRGIPRNTDGTIDKKALKDAGKLEMNEKEVEEIERGNYERLREFERLRRLANAKLESRAADSAASNAGELLQGYNQDGRPSAVPSGTPDGVKPAESEFDRNERVYEKDSKLSRPTEI